MRNTRTTIDEIADEDHAAPSWMTARLRCVYRHDIPELVEQIVQLIAAAVNVADDVERPVIPPAIVPERLAHDFGGIGFGDRPQHVHVTEPFLLQISKRAA